MSTAQNQIVTDQFNIQITAKMTGVNPHTIRAWEKRYQAVVPDRDPKGRRVYNKDEVSRLALLNQLVFNGHNISSIAGLGENELNDLYSNLFNKEFNFDELHEEVTTEPFNTQTCLQNLSFALITHSFNIVNHELDKARQDLNGYSFIQNLILPFLKEIEESINDNRIDHFQYESLLMIIKSQLQSKVASGQTVSDDKIQALLIHSHGLKNEIQSYIHALTLQSEKVSFQYVGSQISPESLAMLISQYKSEYIIYSVQNESEEAKKVHIYDYFKRLKDQLYGTKAELWTVGTKKALLADTLDLLSTKELKEELISRKELINENIA